MSRARVIRASAEGTRWAGPALDSTLRTASPVGGQFRAADSPSPPVQVEPDQDHEDGYQKGYAAGLQAAQQKMAHDLSALANLTAYLREPVSILNEQVDDELVRLVLAITRQVVRREVRADPQQIAAVVREARGALDDVRGKLCISLHPEEAELVRAMFTSDESLAGIVVEEDPSITRGGCTLTSDTSFVDARMETRIAQIAVGLLGDEREPRSEQVDE